MGQAAPPTFHSDCTDTSRHQFSTGVSGMSSGKFSAQSRRHEVLKFRENFARTWARMMQCNFDSPAHAAHVFQVDSTTAENWWEGRNAPSGWVVARAVSNPAMRDAALNVFAGAA